MEVLEAYRPGHGVDSEALRPFLQDGFPWHRSEVGHTELTTADAWWDPIEVLMIRAYEGVGIDRGDAVALAKLARERFVNWSIGWQLFEDTLPVLRELADDGWRHAILSNHVPELPALVDGLRLGDLVDVVLTSAVIGYDKPHPRAFALALEACGNPDPVWMVGDNPIADVAGAEAAGIRAIQVRSSSGEFSRRAGDLHQAAVLIGAMPASRRRYTTLTSASNSVIFGGPGRPESPSP
jgi:putative hydrolase of the HAD superfamily